MLIFLSLSLLSLPLSSLSLSLSLLSLSSLLSHFKILFPLPMDKCSISTVNKCTQFQYLPKMTASFFLQLHVEIYGGCHNIVIKYNTFKFCNSRVTACTRVPTYTFIQINKWMILIICVSKMSCTTSITK